MSVASRESPRPPPLPPAEHQDDGMGGVKKGPDHAKGNEFLQYSRSTPVLPGRPSRGASDERDVSMTGRSPASRWPSVCVGSLTPVDSYVYPPVWGVICKTTGLSLSMVELEVSGTVMRTA